MNIRVHGNIVSLTQHCIESDIIVACELHLKTENSRGFVDSIPVGWKCVLGSPDQNSIIYVAVLLRKQIGAANLVTSVTSVSCLVNCNPPFVFLGAYVRPNDRVQVKDFNKCLKDSRDLYKGAHVVVVGDINFTTNSPFLHIPLKDCTPPEHNFSRNTEQGPCFTRPNRIFLSDSKLAHSFLSFKPPFGDGHSILSFSFIACWASVYGAKSFVRHVKTTLQYINSFDPTVQRASPPPLHALHRFIKNPNKRLYRKLKPWADKEGKINARKLIKEWLHNPKPNMGTGGPMLCMDDDSNVVLDTRVVETLFVKHFSERWGKGQSPLQNLRQIRPNEDIWGAPFTNEEMLCAFKKIKPNKVSKDFYANNIRDDILNKTVDTSFLTQLHNTVNVHSLFTHTALIHKQGKNLHPSNFRPISLLPLWFKVHRQLQCNRLLSYIPQISLHPRLFSFRKGRSLSSIIYITHALASKYGKNISIFQEDGTCAYDNIYHEAIDKLLDVYGFGGPSIYYSNKIFWTQLILGFGLSKDIRIKRGLLQGDPLSCIIFMLLGDYILRSSTQLQETLFYALAVDDVLFILRNEQLATYYRIKQELENLWGLFGIHTGKHRVITLAQHNLAPYVSDTGGRILGGCLYLKETMFCNICTIKTTEFSRRLFTLQNRLNEIDIVQHLQPFCLSLFAYWPSVCIEKTASLQKELFSTISRGIPNPKTPIRGITCAYPPKLEHGGRGIPIVKQFLIKERARGLLLAMSLGEEFAELIYDQYMRPRYVFPLSIFKTLSKDLLSVNIFIRKDKFTSLECVNFLLPPCDFPIRIACCDASFVNGVGKIGIIGIGEDNREFSCTIMLSGKIRSSYEAELCGVLLTTMYSPQLIYCDNQAVVNSCNTIFKSNTIPPQKPYAAIFKFLLRICKPDTRFVWVKGHVDWESANNIQRLNIKADILSKAEQVMSVINVCNLELWDKHCLIDSTSRRHISDVTQHFENLNVCGMIQKWEEVLQIQDVVDLNYVGIQFALTKTHRASFVHLTKAHVILLNAIRARALFPRNIDPPPKCICRAYVKWDLHHIAFKCKHEKHKTHPISLFYNLQPYSHIEWAYPKCFERNSCSCVGFTCTHLLYGFSPLLKRQCPEVPIIMSIYLNYIFERMKICYPGNWQV